VVLGQAIPASALFADGLALVMVVQAAPFQCSTSVWADSASASRLPTAKQLVALGHATANSTLLEPGLGLDMVVHVVPFQRCTTV
jgi:hypothetical protein